MLWSDGAGFTLTALFGGTADVTYIRALTLSKAGPAAGNSSAALTRLSPQWIMQGEPQLLDVPLVPVVQQEHAVNGWDGGGVARTTADLRRCLLPCPFRSGGRRAAGAGHGFGQGWGPHHGSGAAVLGRAGGGGGGGRLGRRRSPCDSARCPPLQATPVRAGRPIGVVYTTPYLRVRAQQASGQERGAGGASRRTGWPRKPREARRAAWRCCSPATPALALPLLLCRWLP